MTGGFAGFLASMASAIHSAGPAPSEWPVGIATSVVTLGNGEHAVPLPPSGRIQVYDRDWRYKTGWWVDAGGGDFVIQPGASGTLVVTTVRTDLRLTYDSDGRLIQQVAFTGKYWQVKPSRDTRMIFTKPWFFVLYDPFVAWGVGVLGMAMLAVAFWSVISSMMRNQLEMLQTRGGRS